MCAESSRPDCRSQSPAPGRRAATRARSSGQERRDTGRRGEDLAAAHLERLGFSILARNVRTARGEIDLIAREGGVIAFVEVKTSRLRSAPRAGGVPFERLGRGQRRRLRALAGEWLRGRPEGRPRAAAIRLDAIGVLLDAAGDLVALEHLEGAW